MMCSATLAVVLSCGSGLYGQSRNSREPLPTKVSPRFQLLAEVEPASGSAGSPILLTLRLRNVSSGRGYVLDTLDEQDYEIRVTDQAGKEVERTSYGRHLAEDERGGSAKPREIEPGTEAIAKIDVSKIYALTKPGRYFARVTRVVAPDAPSKFVEKAVSNPIAFIVVE